jgi:hypothetical protein
MTTLLTSMDDLGVETICESLPSIVILGIYYDQK